MAQLYILFWACIQLLKKTTEDYFLSTNFTKMLLGHVFKFFEYKKTLAVVGYTLYNSWEILDIV